MISEKDIQDFKDIDCTQAVADLDKMSDELVVGLSFARSYDSLLDLIKKIELIQEKIIKESL